MTFIAHIEILPKDALLDPQGKAVTGTLHTIGMDDVMDVRVGKAVRLHIKAETLEEARHQAEVACTQVLVNPIMEQYAITILEG